MPRVETVRSQILSLRRAAPFHKFQLNMENGDRVLIEHPENIAFDSSPRAKSHYFAVVTGKVQFFSNFEAVTGVVIADRNGAAE